MSTPGQLGKLRMSNPKLSKLTISGLTAILVIISVITYMLLNPYTKVSAIPTDQIETRTLIPTVTATGQIANDKSVPLSPSQVGQIIKVNFKRGDIVNAQDVLAELNNYPLARQAVDTAHQHLDNLNRELALAQQKLRFDQISAASSTGLSQDQATINLVQAQLESAQKLQADAQEAYNIASVVPQAQLLAAQQEVDKAQAGVEQAQALLKQAQTKLTADQANSASASASSQLSLDNSAIQLAQTQVTAAQQAVIDAQNQLSASRNATTLEIASLKNTLDQSNGNVSIYQATLAQAQSKLADDQAAGATQAILNQDQQVINIDQQQLYAAQTLAQDAQSAYNQAVANQNNSTQVAAAQTALDQAQSNLAVNQALLSQAYTKLAVDQANGNHTVAQDQASLDLAQSQLNSAQKLFKDVQNQFANAQQVSPNVLNNAKNLLDQASGAVAVNAATLHQAQTKLQADQSPADPRQVLADQQAVVQIQEEVNQGKLELAKAQQTLLASEIIAPVDGKIISLDLNTGDPVQPQQPIGSILPSTPGHTIVAKISPTLITKIQAGQAVIITSDNFSGDLKGTVEFVSPVATEEQLTKSFSYPIYVNVSEMSKEALPGMPVEVKIATDSLPDRLSVPVKAVMEDKGKTGVYVKTGDKQYEFKEVEVGISDDKFVQVKGLQQGTVVALQKPEGN